MDEDEIMLLLKTLSVLVIYVMGMAVGILVLLFGWGLPPESWWWIIGGALFQYGLMILSQVIAEGGKNDIRNRK